MSESTNFSTKLKVADKKAEIVQNFDGQTTYATVSSQLKPYSHNHCTEVLMQSQLCSRVKASRNNGFVETVIDCYNRHHNLVIRPDDIWAAILTQLSYHINKNAEDFHGQFVNFDGKKKLEVENGGAWRSASYDLFVAKFKDKINENLVDKDVKDWILPNFTTTTTDDIISCGVVFMATTKKYSDFLCLSLCLKCGIPFITVEGTVTDYEDILVRLNKLKEYKLDKWYDMLKPILKEFIAAKKDKENIKFWNRICYHVGGGCGPRYISGWLTAFAVFDEDGNWTDHDSRRSLLNRILEPSPWPMINIDKIPYGIITVDVTICEGGEEYESVMFAGHIGHEVLEDNCTLKPQIGWGIALKLSEKEVAKFHKTARENGRWCCEQCNLYLKEGSPTSKIKLC